MSEEETTLIPEGTPSMLTVVQVADLLMFSERTVHRWIAEKKLKVVQPGGPKGKILIPVKAVETFMLEQLKGGGNANQT